MTLDEKQKEKVLKSLTQKWPEPRVCSVCHQQQWNVSDKVFEIREFHGGSLVVGGPVVPVIAATCTNCGNTLFFNAILLGVVRSERKEATNE